MPSNSKLHKKNYISYDPAALAAARQERNLSIPEVAALTEIPRMTIHRLEKRQVIDGKYPRAGLVVLQKLATRYKVALKKILP